MIVLDASVVVELLTNGSLGYKTECVAYGYYAPLGMLPIEPAARR